MGADIFCAVAKIFYEVPDRVNMRVVEFAKDIQRSALLCVLSNKNPIIFSEAAWIFFG